MKDTRLVKLCRRVAERAAFQNAVLFVILINAVLVGVETWPAFTQRYGPLLGLVNALVVATFVFELAVRFGAAAFSLRAFFRDGWNAFDSIVVLLSLLPGVGSFATIGRIARVVRITRLVSAAPKLRLIISTMLRSIPSLGHVSLLLSLLLYVYAIIGVNLFRPNDPEHWGSLGRALLTLFQMLTLEGWVEIQNVTLKEQPWAWVYFASFVIVAVFVVVNLFIAVVLNNLDEIREEDRRATLDAEAAKNEAASPHSLERHLATIRTELDRVEALARTFRPPS